MKTQCSKCLEWFTNIDRHRHKGCQAAYNKLERARVLPREDMNIYDRLDMVKRASKRHKNSDPEHLDGDVFSDGFDMLDEDYAP